jgi:hypothetical protein
MARECSVPDCRSQAAHGEQRCEFHLQRMAIALARLWPLAPPAFGWVMIGQKPPRPPGSKPIGRPPKQPAITSP